MAFLKALFWGEKLVDSLPVKSGWSFQDAKGAYDVVTQTYPNLPPESERNVFVVPETHAAVTGAVFSNHAMCLEYGRWCATTSSLVRSRR